MPHVLLENRAQPATGKPTAALWKRLLAFLLDPLMLGPLFFLLLISQTILTFPSLTFSLGSLLGMDLDFGNASWAELALLCGLRAHFLTILVRALLSRSLVIAAFLSAASLCYFPFAIGWLGWGALVPILWLTRSSAPAWRIYLYAWYAGLAFFWPALEWMRVADFRMYGTGPCWRHTRTVFLPPSS